MKFVTMLCAVAVMMFAAGVSNADKVAGVPVGLGVGGTLESKSRVVLTVDVLKLTNSPSTVAVTAGGWVGQSVKHDAHVLRWGPQVTASVGKYLFVSYVYDVDTRRASGVLGVRLLSL